MIQFVSNHHDSNYAVANLTPQIAKSKYTHRQFVLFDALRDLVLDLVYLAQCDLLLNLELLVLFFGGNICRSNSRGIVSGS